MNCRANLSILSPCRRSSASSASSRRSPRSCAASELRSSISLICALTKNSATSNARATIVDPSNAAPSWLLLLGGAPGGHQRIKPHKTITARIVPIDEYAR